ncbi:MAG: hypothetical protein AUK35_08335 [Zetaproteobacteria bacterium CG2_30_46_52]|nr:MAG: hypothetical protein AUK35_08335 [Zetaproteobacteria bacterium CG2_30_46_52]
MSGFMFTLLAVATLVALAIFWKNREEYSDSSLDEKSEDDRVAPLLKGINYLLSDQPDQALQEMVQVAKIRSESAEVYMALGEMFRAQGEYGRAVRIHQNLLARPDVPKELSFQAYVSLGRDFQAGGLLDRALRHYAKALEIQTDHLESLQACLRIREQSHEWDKAEWLVSRLEQIQDVSYHDHRAYLKAEMASDAYENGDILACHALVDEALALSMACTHAHLLLIQTHIDEKAFDKALSQASLFLKHVKKEHHALLPSVLMSDEAFYNSYAEAFLLEAWTKRHDTELGIAWIENITKMKSAAEGKALRERLNLKDVSLRHELRLLAMDKVDSNLVEQTKYWRLTMKLFACKKCGVQVHDMRYHCPKCNLWGTMEPMQAANVFGEEQNA